MRVRTGRRRWGPAVLLAGVSLVTGGIVYPGSGAAVAESKRPAGSTQEAAAPVVSVVPKDKRDAVLGKAWKKSGDVAWTSTGDSTGFHLLVADEDQGYAWRTAATLSEPGIEADAWVGNVCLTASGRRAVVAYAPRTFTNKAELSQRGAFTAVVDITTGEVTKLGVRASLAYFSPGCGDGETAVLTQERIDDDPASKRAGATRLFTVNAARATLGSPVEVAGQVTSAVPADGRIVAAAGHDLVRVGRGGRLTRLARTAGVASRLAPDTTGGLVFLDYAGDQARVRRLGSSSPGARMADLASGKLGELGLRRGTAGRSFITGSGSQVVVGSSLPSAVRRLDVPVGSEVSTQGQLAIVPQTVSVPAGKPAAVDVSRESRETVDTRVGDGEAPVAVRLRAKILATGKQLDFSFAPGARAARRIAEGAEANPLLTKGIAPAEVSTSAARTSGASRRTDAGRVTARVSRAGARSVAMQAATSGESTPVDIGATCGVPRNDVRKQAYQPTPRQVEWAVDEAVAGKLLTARPANWKNTGMASYAPQKMFPRLMLANGASVDQVPAQVMLGILAQESNLWQASNHALPGETGNPLVGNFYGRETYDADTSNDWDINFSEADCGYGISQVTDGMRKAGSERAGEVARSRAEQEAIALDYAANISAGLRILTEKWNETYKAGLSLNDVDPHAIENWFFAIWAYNSGFHPNQHDGQPWGLGWANNPANPRYTPERHMFHTVEADAKHPQDWPYPERVIGWAAYPIYSPYMKTKAYNQAWWTKEMERGRAIPPASTFCDKDRNDCIIGETFTPNASEVVGEPAGPCAHKNANGRYDLKCWWAYSADFHDCSAGLCGHENLRYCDSCDGTSYTERPDGTSYPPRCDLSGLPSGALVVDDVPAGTASSRSECTGAIANRGRFDLTFGSTQSKIDFHQVGTGYGGHNWFAHTQPNTTSGRRFKVSGTWTLGQPLNSWARVMVHLPGHHAVTQRARYVIKLGNGTTKTRYASQLAAGAAGDAWTPGQPPPATGSNTWLDLGVMQFAGTPSVTLDNISREKTGKRAAENPAIAWDAVAFVPLSAKPKDFVVALGDDFSSGEGATTTKTKSNKGSYYYQETDFNNGVGVMNLCHRSAKAWPRLGVLSGSGDAIGFRSDAMDPTLDFHLLACSGATLDSVLPGGTGQWQEVSQLDQGYIDENTTLVTLTLGWNDVELDAVYENNLNSDWLWNADNHQNESPLYTDSDSLYFSDAYDDIEGEFVPGVKKLLGRIQRMAPNAKIIVMGYPEVFPRVSRDSLLKIPLVYLIPTLEEAAGWVSTDLGVCSRLPQVAHEFDNVDESQDPVEFTDFFIGVNESFRLNLAYQEYNQEMARLAVELRDAGTARVTFVNPLIYFGGHDVCSDTPGVHGTVYGGSGAPSFSMTDILGGAVDADRALVVDPGLDKASVISQQSLRPTIDGSVIFGNLFTSTLRKAGM